MTQKDPKEKPKKERVLHTRISEALDRELRDKAAELGVSVSKLVRNALVNTVDLVESIVADGARVAENATHLSNQFNRPDGTARATQDTQANGPRGTEPAADNVFAPGQVIGWQDLVLNLNAVCVECNMMLPKGSHAFVGLTPGGLSHQVLCEGCLKLQQP